MLRADMESDASQTELMEIILRESDRLNRIISDFLSYARPRSIIQTKVNVGELLQQTFMLLRHSAEINRAISSKKKSRHTGIGQCDSEQLQQVFWNLSRNALQAMPSGGTLRAAVYENSNDRLRITFSDTGVAWRQNRSNIFLSRFLDYRWNRAWTFNRLSNHSRSWWYNQRAQS